MPNRKQYTSFARVFVHPFYGLHCIKDVSLEETVLCAAGELQLPEEKLNKIVRSIRKSIPVISFLHVQEDGFTPEFTRYMSSLLRILRASPSSILLAEEKELVDKTIPVLRKLGYRQPLLYYNTQYDNPFPHGFPGSSGFAAVARELYALGVSALLVGGQRLTFDFQYGVGGDGEIPIAQIGTRNHETLHCISALYRCAGWFAKGMVREKLFNEIALSKVSFPYYYKEPKR